jgi:hypothetical protein
MRVDVKALSNAQLLDVGQEFVRVLFFKLEEEENITLLLLLPANFAETTVFGLASGLSCILVVATAQAVGSVKTILLWIIL